MHNERSETSNVHRPKDEYSERKCMTVEAVLVKQVTRERVQRSAVEQTTDRKRLAESRIETKVVLFGVLSGTQVWM